MPPHFVRGDGVGEKKGAGRGVLPALNVPEESRQHDTSQGITALKPSEVTRSALEREKLRPTQQESLI